MEQCQTFVEAHGGYVGPYITVPPPAPPKKGPFNLENGGRCLAVTNGKPKLGSCGAGSNSSIWYTASNGLVAGTLQTAVGACLKIHAVATGSCATWTQVYLGECRADANSFTLNGTTLLSNLCVGHCAVTTSAGAVKLSSCDKEAAGWSLSRLD